MISIYDVKRAYDKSVKEGTKLWFTLKDDYLYDSETNEQICSISTYVEHLRDKLHCNFERLFEDPASLMVVYKCSQCGAVIFASDNVEDYDPALCCPVCGGYKTSYDYWTKEDIESDIKKQNTLKFYDEWNKESEESYKRQKRRGGLYDWQVHIWRLKFKKKHIYLKLECDNLFKTKLKGLKLKYEKFCKDEDDSFILNKSFIIPLSFSAFYIQFLYPYSKKCHPDFRKYFPWQRRNNA